jgi:hypothetical protein
MKLVKIVHSKFQLESKVPESAVQIWRLSGWVPKGEESPAPVAPVEEPKEVKAPVRRKSIEGEG